MYGCVVGLTGYVFLCDRRLQHEVRSHPDIYSRGATAHNDERCATTPDVVWHMGTILAMIDKNMHTKPSIMIVPTGPKEYKL